MLKNSLVRTLWLFFFHRNKFEAPSLEEGFTEIVSVNFVPSFKDPELKKLYQMYLLEKWPSATVHDHDEDSDESLFLSSKLW